MVRLAEVTGYRQASKDLDAAVSVFCDKEGEMADVQATTIPGALVRLETALKTVADSDDPDTFERMALGALADLKRLTTGLA